MPDPLDETQGLPARRAPRVGSSLADASMSWTGVDGLPGSSRSGLRLIAESAVARGLELGRVLVDEVTVLKAATEAHTRDNDQERAFQLLHARADTLRTTTDPALGPEREMVFALEATLGRLAGRHGESPTTAGRHAVTGLPAAP